MDRLAQILADITNMLSNSAPSAAQVTLEAARLQAIQIIIGGFVCAAVSIAFAFAIRYLYKKGSEAYQRDRYSGGEIPFVMAGIPFGIVAVLSFGVAIERLSTAAAWVGIFKPEIYIAYQVLNRLGG